MNQDIAQQEGLSFQVNPSHSAIPAKVRNMLGLKKKKKKFFSKLKSY